MAVTDAATSRVLIVDTHEQVRATLEVDLHRYANLRVVGVAANGVQAIATTQQLLPEPQAEVLVQSAPVDKFCYKNPKTEAIVDLFRQARGPYQGQKYLEKVSPGNFHLQNQGYMNELKNGRY